VSFLQFGSSVLFLLLLIVWISIWTLESTYWYSKQNLVVFWLGLH
jgi:hypothetical protein